jgi:uncharacterized membrane protein YcaP (DUF421 family)
MQWIESLFGLDGEKLLPGQMAARATLVFFVSLMFVRIAGLRALGKASAFDHLTALMLGAIMGRSVVSAEQSFFGSLLAALVIMVLHRILARITFASHAAGRFLKGAPVPLVRDGVKLHHNMKRTCITEADIEEEQRSCGKHPSLGRVKEAFLERSGKISVLD